jgi:Tol biopolymer transport system component
LFKVTIDDGVFEKYERLNQTLPASGDVGSFKIAPDGKHIAYVADADVDDQNELFVVSPTATDRTRLNAEGETVGLYAFGRESDSIAFVVDHEAYLSGLGTSDQAQLLDTIKSTQTFASIAPYSTADEATFSVLDAGTYAAHVDADARLITTTISYVLRIP